MSDIEIFQSRIMVPGPSGTVVGGDAITDLQTEVAELKRVLNSQIESIATGRVYGPLSTISGYPPPTGVAISANTVYVGPVYIPQNGTFNVAGIEVTTVAAAGGTMRLGIYEALANGFPGALIADFGTIDTTVGGFRSVPIAITLSRGSYWLAGASSSTVSVARVPSTAGITATMGHFGTTGNDPRSGLRAATALASGFTALPAIFGQVVSITSIFAFWLQAA